ncbi:tubulin-binding prefolding complex subunit PAC10 [Sporobolomyces koalae]|uniref:tubulin-binding prefolding complex subunit PAC10 n=1 Tax=Sporobolomyces koalae TaxID=500713 RepID=UPI003179BB22
MSTTSTSRVPPGTTITNETNPRGIPKAAFIESVPDFIGGPDGDAEVALKSLEESLAKYRFMEQSSLQRRAGLEEKVPELERTIDMVDTLIRKKEQAEAFETTFELSDTLYAKGIVEQVDEVYIWLGASTMLSYPLDSARSLLSHKLDTAQLSLANVREDLAWLRDQITVCEVGIARVYNWDVARRRDRRKAVDNDL